MRRMVLVLAATSFVLFCIALFALFAAAFAWKAKLALENSRYARQVFQGVVSYNSVIASRRWHHKNNWCTYAIVTLGDDADSRPPGLRPNVGWQFAFGSDDWVATPGPALAPKGDDLWSMCHAALGTELFGRLANVMQKGGGYWRMNHDTVFLYAPEEKLAVLLREGD